MAENRHRTLSVCLCVCVVKPQSCGHQSCREETLKLVRSHLLRHERVSLGRCKPNLLSPNGTSSCAEKQPHPRISGSPMTAAQQVTAQMWFEPLVVLSPQTWLSWDLWWSTRHGQIYHRTNHLIKSTKADFLFFFFPSRGKFPNSDG